MTEIERQNPDEAISSFPEALKEDDEWNQRFRKKIELMIKNSLPKKGIRARCQHVTPP